MKCAALCALVFASAPLWTSLCARLYARLAPQLAHALHRARTGERLDAGGVYCCGPDLGGYAGGMVRGDCGGKPKKS